jgi:hypothetical protein
MFQGTLYLVNIISFIVGAFLFHLHVISKSQLIFFKNKLVLHIVHSYKMEFAIHQSKFLIIVIIIIIIIIIIGVMAILTFIKIRHDKENARMK